MRGLARCLPLCAALPALADTLVADVFVREDVIVDPAPAMFPVCHGFTCTLVTQVSLSSAQWFETSAPFEQAAADPAAERRQIAEAISRFEKVAGAMTGTAGDMAENQKGANWQGPMDCIDESTNTTTYLRILNRAGLLRRHRVEDRVTRGLFLFGMPHTTAVVKESTSGRRWAVDSWFYANGVPPVIVPLEVWRQARWRPGGSGDTVSAP